MTTARRGKLNTSPAPGLFDDEASGTETIVVELEEDEAYEAMPDDPEAALQHVQAGLDELQTAPLNNQDAGRVKDSKGRRSINEIITDLSRPLPAVWLYLLDKGNGLKLTVYPWFRVLQAFDKYAPGWESEITRIQQGEDNVIVALRMCIPCAEGIVCREDVGAAYYHADKVKRQKAFDPALKAKQQALKRAAAQFGFGLYLYDVRRD